MSNNNKWFQKKIGIWGFGVVGQSALTYFDHYNPACIQVLDAKSITLPATKNQTQTIVQNDTNIEQFLTTNDYILVSPGIALHAYQNYAHKFISELDIFQEQYKNSVIAITGTIGKTSITHLLEKIIHSSYPKTCAAGNIGTAMLSILDHQPEHAILELSSFQLNQTKSFAPDLAIITNFYPNHLDHHLSLDEYLHAKCNIIRFQHDQQIALLPLELYDAIQKIIPNKKNHSFFSPTKPTETIDQTIFYLDDRKIYSTKQHEPLFDLNTLPSLTFDTNWLIIIAACHLYTIDLATIASAIKKETLPDHRLQKVGTYQGCTFYNDSKSTVWQATLQAVLAMGNHPVRLFLGGLSKGADRTPLLKALQGKNIEIYTFGKEATHLAQLCAQHTITHANFQTLDEAWHACISTLPAHCKILFSPGGASFDLFTDYQERGRYFTKLVHNFLQEQKDA